MQIYTTDNNNFNFDDLSLGDPQPIQGGLTYFTPLLIDNKPMYIQLPKCETKIGIAKTKRGKYCDLKYERDTELLLGKWIENLEEKCQDLINKKKDLWFQTELTKEDIVNMMQPVCRLYKSGTYTLIRCYIDVGKISGKDECKIYNENNIELDNLELDREIIPLVLIDGIKFTSRSFEINIKLMQIMVLNKIINNEHGCLIKKTDIKEEKLQPEIPIKLDLNTNKIKMEHNNHDNKDDNDDNDNYNDNDDNDDDDENDNNDNENFLDKLEINNLEENIDVEPENSNFKEKEKNSLEETLELNSENKMNSLGENNNFGLEEVNLEPIDSEIITLKKPNEVYYEIYKAARKKAKNIKNMAVAAYLEAKDIKTKYMLDDISDSDSDNDKDGDDDELNDA